jgi:hypothetical protein
MSVKQALSWVKEFMNSKALRRREWVRTILNGIKSFNSKSGEPTSDGIEFAKNLSDRSQFDLIGICPNVMYIKAEGPESDLKSIWVHAWGTPVLLYKHKKTCALVIAGPGIRLNDSVVREISYNKYKEEILGITG